MIFSLGLVFFKTDLLTGFNFYGLRNITKMLSDPLYHKSLQVTSYYAFAVVPLSLAIGLIIALGLNQGLPAQSLWRTLYYLPSVTSGIAVAMLWMWIFHPDAGLLNQALLMAGIEGPRWLYSENWAVPAFIIMGAWGAGGNMLLYLAGLQGIPTHLYEAARIDGASSLRTFWAITIPMLSPTIFFNLIMGIIGSFQIFTQALVMTSGGPNNATLTIMLYLYRKGFEQFQFGYASAIAWSLFVIVLLLTLLVFRSSAVWVYYEGEVRK
ncbi:MAG: sugar ABC transporter permease [Anaerolineae bacterium]|nr:sugar ABC transporter permease [Anaerolineae bacterium]